MEVPSLKEGKPLTTQVVRGGITAGCSDLRTIDLSHGTSGVIAMNGLLFGCRSLETVDLSPFDTSSEKEKKGDRSRLFHRESRNR